MRTRTSHYFKRAVSLVTQQLSRQLVGYEYSHFKGLTISHLILSPDLKLAKVYVSLFDDSDQKACVEHLNENAKALRFELANTLKLRHTPDLKFFFDTTLSQGRMIVDAIKAHQESA